MRRFGLDRRAVLWASASLLLALAAHYSIRALPEERLFRVFEFAGRSLELSDAGYVGLLAAIPLLLFALGKSLADLPWQQRVLSLLLRAAFFLSLLVGLARPEETERSNRVCTVALLDVSTSVADGALEEFRATLAELDRARSESDELRLLGFGEGAAEIPLKRDPSGKLIPPQLSALRAVDSGRASNLEEAVRLASAFTGTDCVSRFVLFTDGIETRGQAASAIAEARARGVRVHTRLLSEAPPADVSVSGVTLPGGVKTGEPFRVRVDVNSTGETSGQLRLYQGNVLNGLDGAREVKLGAGVHSEFFETVVRVPGDVSYRAEFVPSGDDQFSENNQFVASVEVPGPPRVLLVDREPAQIAYFTQALVAQQLDVDVRDPAAMPQSASELRPFQFVILSDLARKNVSRSGEKLVLDYVRGGGGLLFAGGEASFGPGGWQGSAMERALPVRMDGQKEREIPGVAMALVIDRSGSMGGLPLAMAKEACKATLGVLSPSDLIEVIAFDSRPKRFVKMQPARYRARIESSVSTISPGGGTEIFASLDMAYQDLLSVEARKKHIIMLTDGNAGSDGIYELSGAAFAEGITVTSVGLGGGVNRSLLTMMAEEGGGRFHAAEDPSRLPRIFTRETELISKKSEVSDWFPVGLVRSAEFLKGVGIGGAPLLRGYTSTQMKPTPSELILQSDRGEPILARRPFGLGSTLAWTSDLKSRWATDWLRWGQFGRLFAQMIREHQKSDDTEVRPMRVEIVGGTLVATLEAYDSDENFDNTLSSTLAIRLMGAGTAQGSQAQGDSVLQPSSEAEQTSSDVPFQLVAPGTYQARAELREFGAYSLKATHQRDLGDGTQRAAGVSFASVSRPYPEEYRDFEAKPALLASWAELGRGQSEGNLRQIFEPGDDHVEERVPRQNEFLIVAIVLFLLDLLMRRVRLFDRRFRSGGGKIPSPNTP